VGVGGGQEEGYRVSVGLVADSGSFVVDRLQVDWGFGCCESVSRLRGWGLVDHPLGFFLGRAHFEWLAILVFQSIISTGFPTRTDSQPRILALRRPT
jgi:hypothetical protein